MTNDNQNLHESHVPTPQDRTELFVSLLGRSELDVHAHILTLVSNWADADDLLQRTNIILWRKFPEWRPEQDFTIWACGIARYEVKNFLRTRTRDRHIFDDALIESMGDVLAQVAEERGRFGNYQEALQKCLQKLGPRDREIIEGCYGDKGVSAKEVAQRLGRPVNTVYKALLRIRRALFECIERTLASEGHS